MRRLVARTFFYMDSILRPWLFVVSDFLPSLQFTQVRSWSETLLIRVLFSYSPENAVYFILIILLKLRLNLQLF